MSKILIKPIQVIESEAVLDALNREFSESYKDFSKIFWGNDVSKKSFSYLIFDAYIRKSDYFNVAAEFIQFKKQYKDTKTLINKHCKVLADFNLSQEEISLFGLENIQESFDFLNKCINFLIPVFAEKFEKYLEEFKFFEKASWIEEFFQEYEIIAKKFKSHHNKKISL